MNFLQNRPGVPPSKSFLGLLVLAAGLTLYALSPFGPSLFLAAVLAVACKPLHHWLARVLRHSPQLAAALLVVALFTLLIAPLASMVAFGVQEVTFGLEWLRDELGVHSLADLTLSRMPPQLQEMVDGTANYLHVTRADLRSYAGVALNKVQGAAPAVLGFSVNLVIDAGLMLVAFYFFVVDGERVINFITRISPLKPEQTQELLHEFYNVSRAALVGTVVTAFLQSIIVGIGFMVAGIPHAVFFALCTLLASFVPVVGATLLWAPAAMLLALNGSVGAAVALALWCFVAIFVVEHVAKPLLMRGGAEVHAGVMFFALLGGLTMFGLVGVVAGPLIIAFFLALLRMYERDFIGGVQVASG